MKEKKIDKVREALRGLENYSYKTVRELFSEEEIGGQQLKNILGQIKKEAKVTKFHNATNTRKNDYLLPSNVYLCCLSLYGQEWGRLLSYLLTQTREDVLLPQAELASCHSYGFNAIRNGKEPSLRLASEMYERLHECPFNIFLSDYVPNKSCRTVLNFEYAPEVLEQLSKPSASYVNIWTGDEVVDGQIPEGTPSLIPEIEEVRQRLLNQAIDYKGLLEKRRSIIYGVVNAIENPTERIKQLAILNRIHINPKPVYSAVEKSARLYTSGPSFQGLTRAARAATFSGFRQFDLKQAQLMIIAKLWNAPEVAEFFKGQSIWQLLISQTGLKKDTLKRGVYTLIFGGTYNNAVMNMSEVEGVPYWKVKHQIAPCRFFNILEAASKRFSKHIRESKSCIDAFGRELVKTDKLSEAEIRSIKGCQAQSYEVAVMLPVLNHLMDKGFSCTLLLHDGFISDYNSYYIYQELKGIAESVGRQFGMNLTLEMEVIE